MRRADPLSGIFGITNNTYPAVGTEGLDVAVAMPAGEKLGERELA